MIKKPTIFYFVHAHGSGHRATFNMLYPALAIFFKVIAITTNNEISGYLQKKHNVQVLELPPKYPPGYEIPEHTFSKAFEVTPYAVEPAGRAKALAEAIEHYKPKALYYGSWNGRPGYFGPPARKSDERSDTGLCA